MEVLFDVLVARNPLGFPFNHSPELMVGPIKGLMDYDTEVKLGCLRWSVVPYSKIAVLPAAVSECKDIRCDTVGPSNLNIFGGTYLHLLELGYVPRAVE